MRRRSGRERKTNSVYAEDYEDVDDLGNPLETPKKKARRAPSKGTGSWSEIKTVCQKVLRSVMNHQHAWPFNQPVDPVALNLPDYFDKIKRPMDFGTIQKKMSGNGYSNIEQFAADMRLVFTNCWTYNLPGSDIYIMATTLSNLFEKQFKAVKAKVEEKVEGQELNQMQQTISQLQSEHQKLLNELKKLKSSSPTPPAGTVPLTKVPVKSKLPKIPKKKAETFGYKQKVALNNRINKLGQENLQKMVEIIAHEINTPKDGELEIDLEKLSVPTLKKLDLFARNCLKTQQTEQETTKEDEEDPSSSSDSDSSSSSSSESDSASEKEEADESKPKQALESEPTN